MIELTKINGDPIVLNCRLIESIVLIPETKVIMDNGKYHLVKEDVKTIIDKVTEFEQNIVLGAGNYDSQLTRSVKQAAGEPDEMASWLMDACAMQAGESDFPDRENLKGNGREV